MIKRVRVRDKMTSGELSSIHWLTALITMAGAGLNHSLDLTGGHLHVWKGSKYSSHYCLPECASLLSRVALAEPGLGGKTLKIQTMYFDTQYRHPQW